jgi:hypothetical protein
LAHAQGLEHDPAVFAAGNGHADTRSLVKHVGLLNELAAFADTGSLGKCEISAFNHCNVWAWSLTFGHVSLFFTRLSCFFL